jgi:quaternary ammonium compound-resistance protein SugE
MIFAATPTTAWTFLVIAGLLEVVWAIGMKYSEGFTRLAPSIVTIVVKILPVGTAYAAWTGIGAVGAAVLGMFLFKEPATAARIVCIVLIIAGIAGLYLLGPNVDA